jgi:hypothetical protein
MVAARVARLTGGAVIAVTLVALCAGPSSADAKDAIDRARDAATATSYTGTLTVRWADNRGPHSMTVDVKGAGGVVRMDGPAKLAATSSARWLFRDGNWDLMSPSGLNSVSVPAPVKYDATSTPGPVVAGRPTNLVVFSVGGQPEERWYQDAATGLLLRRELLSPSGAVVRSVGFDRIDLGTTTGVAPAPATSVDLRPETATTAKKPYVAPTALPDGYDRVAVLKRPGTLHVVYSDGLHGLSMFEQAGRLDEGSVPADGERVAIGRHDGFEYVYAGGQVVVWQADGTTYTLVGDGEPADVLAAARAVPSRKANGLFDRVRRACAKILNAVDGS